MVDLLTSLSAGVAATFIPLYAGLFAPKLVKQSATSAITLLAAGSAGIIFWFFLDVMNDAALLDVNQPFNQGFVRSVTHVILALLFAVGVGVLFGLEKAFSNRAYPRLPNGLTQTTKVQTSVSVGITFAVAAVAALGIGFHALGEGIAIGSSLPSSSSILAAIGGPSAGIAYVLHKLLEGFVVGVFGLLAVASSRKIGILGLISGIPTVIGFFVGIPGIVEPTYFFALGGAGALYVELKLIPRFATGELKYVSILPVLLGFYAMYGAGLLHG
jgi:zinc transporter ZupT